MDAPQHHRSANSKFRRRKLEYDMFEKPWTFNSPRVIIVGVLGMIQDEKNTKNSK